MKTEEKMLHILEKNCADALESGILVALSGGADSCALALLLKNLSCKIVEKHTNFRLCCAHFNHCIRGEAAREDENFVLVFTVQNDAGSLAQTLNIIGAHGYNMRTLRSRPMKDLSWKYFFYVEAEGSINTTNGREMLQELSATCAKLRLVGSYYANNV